MEKLTDDSKMPFGVHKGKALANVPDHYLRWLYENNKCNAQIRQYIEDNADVLNIEINGKSKINSPKGRNL